MHFHSIHLVVGLDAIAAFDKEVRLVLQKRGVEGDQVLAGDLAVYWASQSVAAGYVIEGVGSH